MVSLKDVLRGNLTVDSMAEMMADLTDWKDVMMAVHLVDSMVWRMDLRLVAKMVDQTDWKDWKLVE